MLEESLLTDEKIALEVSLITAGARRSSGEVVYGCHNPCKYEIYVFVILIIFHNA